MKAGLSLWVCAIGVGALLVVASHSLVAGDKGDFNASKLIGKWNYVSGEKSGTKVDPAGLKDQDVTIDKDNFVLKGEAGKFVMKYKIDAKKKPVGINLEITESPFGAGMKANGIIELKGDEFKICYNAEGGDAPKEFKTKDGDKNHLFVLKRAK